MSIKGLKIARGIIYGVSIAASVVVTILGGKIDKAEQLEILKQLVKNQK